MVPENVRTYLVLEMQIHTSNIEHKRKCEVPVPVPLRIMKIITGTAGSRENRYTGTGVPPVPKVISMILKRSKVMAIYSTNTS